MSNVEALKVPHLVWRKNQHFEDRFYASVYHESIPQSDARLVVQKFPIAEEHRLLSLDELKILYPMKKE